MNIKRTIAREGLVIVGIILLGSLIVLSPNIFLPYPKDVHGNQYTVIEANPTTPEMIQLEKERMQIGIIHSNILGIGFCILFFGYPLYLLIRFIVWAIRTLKDK